jgi:arabinose-5-phosphate isomerase
LVERGRQVLEDEAKAVRRAGARLGRDFVEIVERIVACEGRVVVTGMGKANFVAQKISATLASIGFPSLFLHPADALHGDLGRLTGGDVVLALSHSGETDEMIRLIDPLRQLGATLLAMTGSRKSTLGQRADLTIEIGRYREAGNGLAPTTSTTVMLAIGDAIAMAALELSGFSEEAFHQIHPGGALGRRLMRVGELMRTGDALPLVAPSARIRQVIAVMTETRGRPGAAIVVDRRRTIAGIFTDGDLRRLMEQGALDLEGVVKDVMCADPKRVLVEDLAVDAARVLASFAIDQVPVVDERDRVVGLLDIQDLLSHRIV